MTPEEATQLFNEFGGVGADWRSGEVHPIARLAKAYIEAVGFVRELETSDAREWLINVVGMR
jgi:hypothetical protein